MTLNRLSVVLLSAFAACALNAADKFAGENLIDIKIALPKGDTYIRGTTDAVQDLVAEITLTNNSKKENRGKETISTPTAARLTPEEIAQLEANAAKTTQAERDALVEKKKGTSDREANPINPDSFGYAYVEPGLGAYDNIDFVITRLPDEGAPEGAKAKIIVRDVKPEHIQRTDVSPTKYLPAGETSPAYALSVGKFYKITEPGMYTIKAVMRLVGDSGKPDKFAESNEEKFRVLPFKVVDVKFEQLQQRWAEFERGEPNFDYMIYQVPAEGHDNLYYVQRVPIRGETRWEWTRLSSMKSGTQAQVAQISPKKVGVLAVHAKGDAALYTIDFSVLGGKVTFQSVTVKEGVQPRLKQEGGTLSVE